MEEYLTTGRFPAMAGAKVDFVTTSVKTRKPWEILQIFTVVGICGLIWNNIRKAWHIASSFLRIGGEGQGMNRVVLNS